MFSRFDSFAIIFLCFIFYICTFSITFFMNSQPLQARLEQMALSEGVVGSETPVFLAPTKQHLLDAIRACADQNLVPPRGASHTFPKPRQALVPFEEKKRGGVPFSSFTRHKILIFCYTE